jgi:hypothetical protein
MNDISVLKDTRSYLISCLIPAALFLGLVVVIFNDFAPPFINPSTLPENQYGVVQWVFLLLMTIWLGFALYSGWNTTVLLYKGNYLPLFFKKKWIRKMKQEFTEKRKEITQYENLLSLDNRSSDQQLKLERLEPLIYSYYQDLETNFPVTGDLLPTRLGNILRSSELYSFERYRIEAVTIFPRLVNVFPVEYSNKLEESNNEFIFLLNSSFLSYVISFLCAVFALLRFLYDIWNGIFFQSDFLSSDEFSFLLIAISFIIIGYFFYRITIVKAKGHATLIRSGYDLYRYELLKKLYIPLTNDFTEERGRWLNLTYFLNYGDKLGKKPVVPDFKPLEEKDENSVDV